MYTSRNRRPFSYRIYFVLISATLFVAQNLLAEDSSVLAKLQNDIITIVDQVKPSVVTISAKYRYDIINTEETSFFGIKKIKDSKLPLEMQNIGSGFVLDSTHIVTIASVVQGSHNIEVTFANGQAVPAKLVGLDEELGLALLKVEAGNFAPAQFGNDSHLRSGCCVIIVGNSLGVSPAVSFGLVNAIRNDGIIQLSVNVTAGSIGGPVFDINGQLVGILAAQLSPDDETLISTSPFIGNEGALAYPISDIRTRMTRILQVSAEPGGWIGVTAENWPGRTGWVHINQVKAGSPAEKAGLKMGDIVFSMDGQPIHNAHELARRIKHKRPGEIVRLGLIRGDEKRYLDITVGLPRKVASIQMAETAAYTRSTTIDANQQNVQRIHPGKRTTDKINDEFLLLKIRNMEQELKTLRSMIRR